MKSVDIIFNKSNFLPVYSNDIMNASKEILIVSPFVTKKRSLNMMQNLEIALANKVKAFVEYDVGNSGFDDALIDLFFELCKEKEEWEYLVRKLNNRPSDWRKKLVMSIYKNHLNDDTRYLEERLKNLHYGIDYWELVQYYIGKRKKELALETAQKGIEKGEGRLTELYDCLIDHFSKLHDDNALEMIAQTATERKIEVKYVLDKLL